MKKKHDRNKSRREFLKGGLRTAMLGGLVSLGTGLGYRRFTRDKSLQSCTIAYYCDQCNQLSKCDLPEAVSARNSKQTISSAEEGGGATDG